MITKTELDFLVAKYETKEFITSDPIQFIHRGGSKQDIEILGFISALFAFGSRKVFIKKLHTLFDGMQTSPSDFVLNGDFELLNDFDYRFAKSNDVKNVFMVLRKLYQSSKGLEELFEYGYNLDLTIKSSLLTVTDYFYSNVESPEQGFCFLLANPRNGGAMKRLNMFLRWMVRKPPVDLNLWTFITPSELLIPLDVHVSNVSRKMGLLKRSSNDFKAVLELTDKLREFDSEDPIKYDFAMFGVGVEGRF